MTYEEFLERWPNISFLNTGIPSPMHKGLWRSFEATREEMEKKFAEMINRAFVQAEFFQ